MLHPSKGLDRWGCVVAETSLDLSGGHAREDDRLHLRVPPGFALRWLLSSPVRPRRELAHDATSLLERYPAPRVEGLEEIPSSGPYILLASRSREGGLSAWWAALVLTSLAAERAPRTQVRWVTSAPGCDDRERLVSRALGRLRSLPVRLAARRYGALSFRGSGAEATLPRAARHLLEERGQALAAMVECGTSLPAVPTAFDRSRTTLAWLSHGQVPIVPATIHADASGLLRVRFGRAFVLDGTGQAGPPPRV